MKLDCISNIANFNFTARKKESKAPIGLDYSSIDEFQRADYSGSELTIAAKSGKLTPQMREQLILDRLPKTIIHAQVFVADHSVLDIEETTQELISHMVETANSYQGQKDGNFNLYAREEETVFLENLLKRVSSEKDCVACSIHDLKVII
ncbi:MAG: hypothetical protein IKL52_07090 [Candidatus Gastranaerophilales bacterium]|nr:hypothetical protein [Candidatus Gastranaerophilales bacterium]